MYFVCSLHSTRLGFTLTSRNFVPYCLITTMPQNGNRVKGQYSVTVALIEEDEYEYLIAYIEHVAYVIVCDPQFSLSTDSLALSVIEGYFPLESKC